ncbi:hemerythrin domain-containing protein [Devosia sp. XJ19-1]|uniref:Hemerythrin domain-containing protein n=1 Tax=Devosia ureilytica TaxID=2952754 RepID=A0A9Q4AT39_9HYPH|nr:hemerythrin domain-containing protein [Devosia ureilytica]MCP8885455.1 hemerythrin domain-containing protein [Devosia ureilytica]MCP8889007.1 hemerythrin domain-containing protein [Devosia ureilytica]
MRTTSHDMTPCLDRKQSRMHGKASCWGLQEYQKMTPNGEVDLNCLRDRYSRLLDICNLLESIADGLPNDVPRKQCQVLASSMVEQLRATHAIEDRVLMPLLLASDNAGLRMAAERLRQEHEFDDQAAMEVEEALNDLLLGRSIMSPDATGYLLRSFFESVRRHVHAEQDLLHLLEDITPINRSLH